MIEKIQDTIRKLMAKAAGTSNENEAIVFMNKAQELLSKHNLKISDVDLKEKSGLGYHNWKSVNTNQWRGALFMSVAEMYFCRLYIHHKPDEKGVMRKDLVFVGKEHNVQVAISMAEFFETTVLRLAKAAFKERKERLQFEKGCGNRLATRIRIRTEELRKGSSDSSGLPALYNQELMVVDDFMKNIDLRNSKSRQPTYSEAAYKGVLAGNTVSLSEQLKGSKAAGNLLS